MRGIKPHTCPGGQVPGESQRTQRRRREEKKECIKLQDHRVHKEEKGKKRKDATWGSISELEKDQTCRGRLKTTEQPDYGSIKRENVFLPIYIHFMKVLCSRAYQHEFP